MGTISLAAKPRLPPEKIVLRIPTEGGELQVRADKLVEALVTLLDGLGNFVETIGKIETEYPNLIAGMRNVSGNPLLLQQFTESLSPEVLQIFLIILLRLMRISPDLNALTSISTEKKVALGAEIKNISNLVRKLEAKLREG